MSGKNGRVRTSLGFGHGEAGHDVTVEQGLQVTLLLRRGAVVRKDFAVTRVRRLAAKYNRTEQRAPENLIDQGQAHLAITGAPQFRPQMTRPQFARLDLRLQRFDQLLEQRIMDVPRPAQHMIDGFDFGADEPIDPVQLHLKFRVGLKVPGHGGTPNK
ncbi:hypothetical protein D9M71_712750 [compost metagenome]